MGEEKVLLHVITSEVGKYRKNKAIIEALIDSELEASSMLRHWGYKVHRVYNARKNDLHDDLVLTGHAANQYGAECVVCIAVGGFKHPRFRGLKAYCYDPAEAEGLLSHRIYSRLVTLRMATDYGWGPECNHGINKLHLYDPKYGLVHKAKNSVCTIIYVGGCTNQLERNFIIKHKFEIGQCIAVGIRDYLQSNYARIIRNQKLMVVKNDKI